MLRTLCLTAVLLGGSLAHAQSPRAGGPAPTEADATREGTATIAPGTKQDDLAVTFGLAYKAEWKKDATVKP